jgi:hypothetical protein
MEKNEREGRCGGRRLTISQQPAQTFLSGEFLARRQEAAIT